MAPEATRRRYVAPSEDDRRALDAEWAALSRRERDSWRRRAAAHRWVFVIGCNNSGTTLLYEMLGCHPDVTLLPHEGQYLTRLLPLPSEAGAPRVWTERLDAFRLTEDDTRVDTARLCFDWLRQAEPPIKPTIVEKSPPDAIRARWLQHAFPGAYFIAIVRNGYAVVEGIRRRQGYPVDRCARHWELTNRLMLDDAKQLRRFLLVRYEDLFERLPDMAAGIGRFLGIDAAALERVRDLELSVHNMDDATTRLTDYNRRSLANLSSADLAAIDAVAGPMLDRLGYERAGA